MCRDDAEHLALPKRRPRDEYEYNTGRGSYHQSTRYDGRLERRTIGQSKRESGRRQTQGQKNRGTTAVVATARCQVGVQVLRQRRSRAVLQKEARRAMPRLLQQALPFDWAHEEDNANFQEIGPVASPRCECKAGLLV